MHKNLFVLFLSLICAWVAMPGAAKADLTIMPIRIVFESRDRSAELTIINTSKKTNTYRLEWGNRKMKEEGGYETLEAPLDAAFDPEKNLVFSPRQVTVPPGETQRVRISVRRPADLPDGEYRAHLVMKKISGPSMGKSVDAGGGVSIQMGTNVGFSVPVIVRQGEYNASAKILDSQFVAPAKPGDNPSMLITMERGGIHSIAGSMRVYWTPPGQEERMVGQTNNINLFHEIHQRKIGVGLTEGPITSGTIRIAFEGIDKDRDTIYDEKTFPVSQ